MCSVKFLKKSIKNWENVFISAQNGPYIVVDLIPHSHDGLHDTIEIIESCEKMGIDVTMFTRCGYTPKAGDGIRMGRYFHYMQATTKEIVDDLKVYSETL